jgi:hypothetical protein
VSPQVELESLSIAGLFLMRAQEPNELAQSVQAKEFKQIESQTSAAKQPVPWPAMQQKIATVLGAAMDGSVLDCWVNAWKRYKEIEEAAEESLRSPKRPVTCKVVEHSVETTIKPTIQVFLNRALIGTIECEIGLTTHIDALSLELKKGSIVAIGLGACSWSGSIVANEVTLMERDFGEVQLPGVVTLKRPIALAARP